MKKSNYVKVSSYEGRKGEVKRVVLLYSGGLDTSVLLKWIQDEYQAEVIALTLDLGQQTDNLEEIQRKALNLGAKKAIVADVKDEFANDYLSHAIKANGAYEGPYYISTMSRYLFAKKALEVAEQEGADTIAHGCTGKGNDQVRIEGTALTLNPDIKIIAPVREWRLGRDEELEYAKKHHIPVPATVESPYSCDDNMWGVTSESGVIEDPAKIPPLEEILRVCTLPEKAPDESAIVKLEFEKGVPTKLNGEEKRLSQIIIELNKIAGKHGIGITHHIEDRVVGLKVRGVYELPAAHTIIEAHRKLEYLVSTKRENQFKAIVDNEWAHLVYGGLWLEPLTANLNAFIDKMNEKVTGWVKVKLYKGSVQVVALDSPYSLFDGRLATFMRDDPSMKGELFNQNCSAGFIELWSLAMKTAERVKMAQKNKIRPRQAELVSASQRKDPETP